MKLALAILLFAAALSGCGGGSTQAPAPTPVDAVTAYYGTHPGGPPPGDPGYNVEQEYHQPPDPRQARLGEPITLTGTNIGVRLKVEVTGLESVRVGAKPYSAVKLRVENTGIAVHDDALRDVSLTYADGRSVTPAAGVRASCSHGFDSAVRVDVGDRAAGCLLFPAQGPAAPERLQLALELVPVGAGGIWNLR